MNRERVITKTSDVFLCENRLTDDDGKVGLDIHYGIDGERVMCEWTDSTGSVYKKRLYFGEYEITETNGQKEDVCYISSPDGLTAVMMHHGSTYKIYYLCTDHLGSITLLMNDAGNTVERHAYDAWGRKRNVNDWSDYNVENGKLDRGYTGHESLREFGLINMNGRMYDPILGRMLSPDNYVQDPFDIQNYNRYTYCLNNPLKYTDPSGEFLWTVLNAIKDFFVNTFVNVWTQGVNAWTDSDNWKSTTNAFKIDIGLFNGDIGQILSRLTWEAPQTFFGYTYSQVKNYIGEVDRVDYYGGATFCTNENSSNRNGVTLGSYININTHDKAPTDENGKFSPLADFLYMHEYGHYLQSQDYGPGYLFCVGIPSIWDLAVGDGKGTTRIHDYNFSNHDLKWFERNANKRAKKYFKLIDDKWDLWGYPIDHPSNINPYYPNNPYRP